MKEVPGKTALISVTDKTEIEKFKILTDLGWKILSTGGTAKALKNAGIPCILVEDYTGFPEMLDGRVKTLHPKLFAGILADRRIPKHMETLEEHGIWPIDLVVVNLYDFYGDPSVETIDIGGPSLIRAAAKNAACVTVVSSVNDYDDILQSIVEHGEVDAPSRAHLAEKVFEVTSAYDTSIDGWLTDQRIGHTNPFLG